MEAKELPIYTNVICKGEALKIKACKLYSFSEKQKGIMKSAYKALALSDLIYEDAKKVYIQFLKTKVKSTGVYSKIPIFACVYLAALKNDEAQNKREIYDACGVRAPSISMWAIKIYHALGLTISWKGYNTDEKL